MGLVFSFELEDVGGVDGDINVDGLPRENDEKYDKEHDEAQDERQDGEDDLYHGARL